MRASRALRVRAASRTGPGERRGRAGVGRGAPVSQHDGAVATGEHAGLPIHHFSMEQAAEAHAAVEDSMVGKVLIDVADD